MTAVGSQLTTLDVPRSPQARDWRTWLMRHVAGAGRAPLALYAAFTFVLFLLFFLVTFPHELVVRRMIARAETGRVAVEVHGIRLGWTLGYTIDELRLLQRGGDPAVPLLSATNVHVSPSLTSLFRGHVYPVKVSGELYGGTLSGSVDPRAEAFAVDTHLAGVDVGRYAGLRLFMEGALRGKIDGELALEGNALKPATTTGHLSLRAAGVALEGGKLRGITLPDLHFPEIRLAGDIKRGRLELGDVIANGDEIAARGEGNVVLQHPLATSVMSLTLAVRPAPQAPDNIRMAVNLLLPGAPAEGGEKTLRLSGSFENPRVQ
jgi:type II secretion system protein N